MDLYHVKQFHSFRIQCVHSEPTGKLDNLSFLHDLLSQLKLLSLLISGSSGIIDITFSVLRLKNSLIIKIRLY